MTTFIAGGYGCGNVGDDAILQGLKNRLDRNAIEIYVFHKTSSKAILSSEVVDNPDGFSEIAKPGDVLVIGGGNVFHSYESIVTLWQMAKNAKKVGLRVELRGVGLDEIESQKDKELIKQLCEMASVIEVRTRRSEVLLKNVGVTAPIIVSQDYANYIEPDEKAADALKHLLKFGNEYPLVGLSVSLSTKEYEKLPFLIQALRYLLDNYEVNLIAIPHARHFASRSENDYIPAEIIFSELRRQGRYDVLPWGFTPEALLGFYGKLQAVIGMRYHSFVFAHKMDIPVFGISRYSKHQVYLEENHVPYVDWNQLTSAKPLIQALNRFISEISTPLGSNNIVRTTSPSSPKISVIMPTYRHANYIERAIYTLYLQTFEEWELIIVNDCSPDDTEERVLAYFGDARMKYLKNEENIGEWASVIKVLEHCKGKYIAYLHSDDIWYPNHLEVLYNYLEGNPDKQIAYTAMHIWEQTLPRCIKHLKNVGIPEDIDISGREKELIKQGNFMVPVQVMHLKSCYEKHKPPTRQEDEMKGRLHANVDGRLWAKFLQDYDIGFIDIATARWVVHGENNHILLSFPEKYQEYYGRLLVPKKKEQLEKEIIAYFGWDSAKVKERLSKGSSLLADEWRKMKSRTPSEVMQFYSSTENYIFDLAKWHYQPHVISWTQNIVEFCSQKGVKRILDYGCGIGEDGIALAKAGFDVTLADVPSKTFDFAKWRVKKRGLSVKFIEVADDTPLKEKYDCVICLEVLEHLWDPEAIVRHIYQHLSDGGFFIATVSFSDEGNHPMHLKKNFSLKGQGFLQMIKEVGFEIVRSSSSPLIFQKTQE